MYWLRLIHEAMFSYLFNSRYIIFTGNIRSDYYRTDQRNILEDTLHYLCMIGVVWIEIFLRHGLLMRGSFILNKFETKEKKNEEYLCSFILNKLNNSQT